MDLSRLEKLEELARQAEGRAHANRLASRKREVVEKLKVAEQRVATAKKALREEGLLAKRRLADADAADQRLKETTRRLAQYHAYLDQDQIAQDDARAMREEIETERRSARAAIEAIEKEDVEARKRLREAVEALEELEREEQRLQISGDEHEGLLANARSHFIGKMIEDLHREIEDAARHFDHLDKAQQKAQLMIWLGRFRKLQERVRSGEEEEVSEEQERLVERVMFPMLTGISKRHMPGYIEAFRENFTTDWDQYVVEGQELLIAASEDAKRRRDAESRLSAKQAEATLLRELNREEGRRNLAELAALAAHETLIGADADRFRELLAKAVGNLGASDPEVLALARRFRDLIADGREFRALRRRVERSGDDDSEQSGVYEDVAAVTSGRRAIMIGGAVREDARRNIEDTFDFETLEWVPHESHRPAAIGGVERSVRAGGVDVVLLLKNFIGHDVSEKLRPLCEQCGIPCLLVDHGYGVGQIAETLRKGFRLGAERNGVEPHG